MLPAMRPASSLVSKFAAARRPAYGIDARPQVYNDDNADEVRAQLLKADGVLVWVDPIHQGLTRERLDAMLCDVAVRGPWVSAHPDVILKMGIEGGLVPDETSWVGHGHSSLPFNGGIPCLVSAKASKVWAARHQTEPRKRRPGRLEVELIDGAPNEANCVRVLHAQRGSMPLQLTLEEFMARCEPYFASAGCVIDQPFQPRLPEGMICCYMGVDKVVGFGHQLIKAPIPPPLEGPDAPSAQPGPRIMHEADAAPIPGAPKENGRGMDAADDGDARDQCGISSLSSGTPIFFMDRAPLRARRVMCCCA